MEVLRLSLCSPHCSTFSNLTLLSLEEPPVKDKAYRRFQSTIEKVLAIFDTNLQEWADYISFLSRLLKVLRRCITPPLIRMLTCYTGITSSSSFRCCGPIAGYCRKTPRPVLEPLPSVRSTPKSPRGVRVYIYNDR